MPTPKQRKAVEMLSENVRNDAPQPIGKILKDVGYSESVSESPQRVTESKGFLELLEEYLPDDKLMEVHNNLLNSKKIEHMVFPLGPKDADDENLSGSQPNADNSIEKGGLKVERTTMTDEEIKHMLSTVNCTVRRIVHGDTGRHVYYWSPDSTTQKNAIELAYKIKGRIVNKLDAKMTGDINVALVEFIDGNTDDNTNEDTDSLGV
jgi:hypothetical protein